MIRINFTGDDYGKLGSQMQTVKWTYYGDDSTYTNAIASYGTKFAADNWMHKSMGIQLGLTDSLRCQLPENSDGTGYWKVTIYALGYNDFSYEFKAEADNVKTPEAATAMTEEQKRQLTALRDEAVQLLESRPDDSGLNEDAKFKWNDLASHKTEADELLAKTGATAAEATELIADLQGRIDAVKALTPSTTEKTGEATVETADSNFVAGTYQAKVKVTVDEGGKIVSVVDNGTEPGASNASFWNTAKSYFSRFTGKTASEIDGIDATSGATVSLNAVKSAVKSALGTTATTLAAPTIDAADLRTEPVFAADEDAAFTVTGEEGSTTYTKEGKNADASDITDWVKVDESKPVVVAGPSKADLNIDINDITDKKEKSNITETTLNAVAVEGKKKIDGNIEEN